MSKRHFAGLRVVAFESRRATEMKTLIEQHKGVATVAPGISEVPLGSSPEFAVFESALLAGELDLTIFLTGSGVRLLTQEIESRVPRERWLSALRNTIVIARGPKPAQALKELGITVHLRAGEPNTWRELLAALDARSKAFPLSGRRVAVQEYGMMNRPLLKGLAARGALVLRVPVYRWALPDDPAPLRAALENIVNGYFDVALFTTGTQVWHLFKLAAKKGVEDELRRALQAMVVASIGPATSEALDEFEVQTDLVPEHAKMGLLVRHASLHCHALLEARKNPSRAQF